jgi:hypothetical protein
MPVIHFTKDWNGKLKGKFFTTIRRNPPYYQKFVGRDFTVMLKGKKMFTATLFGFETYGDIGKIGRRTVEDDTGEPYEEAMKILRKFIGDEECCLLEFVRADI